MAGGLVGRGNNNSCGFSFSSSVKEVMDGGGGGGGGWMDVVSSSSMNWSVATFLFDLPLTSEVELLLLLRAMMLMCSVPVKEHKSMQYPPSPGASSSLLLQALSFRRMIGNADVVESDGERWKLTSPIAMVMLRGVVADDVIYLSW